MFSIMLMAIGTVIFIAGIVLIISGELEVVATISAIGIFLILSGAILYDESKADTKLIHIEGTSSYYTELADGTNITIQIPSK